MRRLLLLSWFLFIFSSAAFAEPTYPALTGYVTDPSQVLPSEDHRALENRLALFEKESGVEIAVVIVPSLEGESVERYANRLFKEWGIGKKGANNGLLILAAMSDRKMRIEVGYGLEARLTDARAGDIIRDHLAPAFRQGSYASGLSAAVDAILAQLRGEPLPERSGETSGSGDPKIGIIFIGLIIFVIISIALSRGRPRSGGRGFYDPWGSGGSGGFGGRGGGFGGFGGGSSGGGGASGGW